MIACAACIALLSLAPAVPVPTPIPAERTFPPAWVAFERAWTDIVGYTATLTVFEQKGTQTQNVVFDYTFRKPSNVTVHVVEGPNAGVTLAWNGGTTMEAHRGSGFVALFKKTISLHDPLATTIRGSSVDQLSFAAILDHAQQTGGRVSQAPGPAIGGVPTDELTLVPTSAVADTGLTLEIIDIAQTTHLPMRVLAYEGLTLVRSIIFWNVKPER